MHLTKSGNQLDVAVDDSSIEVNTDALRVKALGITNAMLGGSIATSKLANPFITLTDESSTTGRVYLEENLEFLAEKVLTQSLIIILSKLRVRMLLLLTKVL
ncbi:MAG: hypothetical protein CM15mV8_0650 [Caudoviricetes sp.]|nr:MAG: hypothetical protein CM15mV8_0650 [Caudoviricetes sp.]